MHYAFRLEWAFCNSTRSEGFARTEYLYVMPLFGICCFKLSDAHSQFDWFRHSRILSWNTSGRSVNTVRMG